MIKRITLFVALFIGSLVYINAQNLIFEEDWSGVTTSDGHGSVPSDWTLHNDGQTIASDMSNAGFDFFQDNAWEIMALNGGENVAMAISWYQQPVAADRWLISPKISIPQDGGSVLQFSDLSALVGAPDEYEIRISTSGTDKSDFGNSIYTATPKLGYFTDRQVSLKDYAGQDIHIAFVDVQVDGGDTAIGRIKVLQYEGTDLEVNVINTVTPVINGDQAIKAVVTNIGGNTITSFDASWSVDGDTTTHTQTFDNLSIGTTNSHEFTFDELWEATTGSHNIEVTISNVNGEGADDDSSNDTISKDIDVASDWVQNRPLYEEFTSSMCPPCATWNEQVFDPYFSDLDGDGYNENYSLIRYQYWIPNADPYFTNEGLARGTYYNVNADPTMFIDGVEGDYGDAAYFSDIPPILKNNFENSLAHWSFFDMDVQADFNDENVDVTVNTTPFISGDYTLYVAIVEKHTTGNVGVNGETDFYQVMMKMLPDADGTQINFVDGQDDTQSFSIDLTDKSIMGNYSVGNNGPTNGQSMAPNVEDFNDLEVVAWIQDDNTHQVMQSNVSNQGLGTKDHSSDLTEIAMYPNPSKGTLHIATQEPVNVSIADVLGHQVFTQNEVDNSTELNLTNLSSGIYLVTIKQKGNTTTKKLIIK